MARNVEIKARVDDPAALRERDAVLAAHALVQSREIGCNPCVDCADIDRLARGAER